MQLGMIVAGHNTALIQGGRAPTLSSQHTSFKLRQQRCRSRMGICCVGTDKMSSDIQSKDSAMKAYLEEVKRFLDKTDVLLKTQPDLPTSLSARTAQAVLQFLLSSNQPPPPPAAAAPQSTSQSTDYSRNYSNDASKAYSQNLRSSPPSDSFGSYVGGTKFGSESSNGSEPTPQQSPQVAATFKLAKAILFGLSTSLLFGTLPFIDFLQAPDGREAAKWALFSAAYLWAVLALVRVGKLSADRPFRLLPDETEVTSKDSSILEVSFTAFTSSLAAGFVFRGAWLVLFASTGDMIASMDPSLRGLATQSGVVVATAVAEGSWRYFVTSKATDSASDGAATGSINGYDYRGGGAAAISNVVPAGMRVDSLVVEVLLSALLAAETLSTGSLLGSVASQTLGMIVAYGAAKGGWMDVKDVKVIRK